MIFKKPVIDMKFMESDIKLNKKAFKGAVPAVN